MTWHLALDLARRYLRNPTRSTWLDQSDPAHYNVADERTRIKEALDRLEPHQRAAFLLSQVAGIPEQQIRSEIEIGGDDDRHPDGETIQSRITLAASRPPDAPVIDLLNRVLVEAPTTDLWPEIEEPVQRAWSARRRSERLLTAAAIAVVFVTIAAAIVWLGGFFPGGGSEDDSSAARNDQFTAELLPTPTVARAAFAAAPTLPPAAASVVRVEDLHFLRAVEQAGEGRSTLDLYDPATNASTPLLTAGDPPLISPDGRWIISTSDLLNVSGMSLLAGGLLDGSASWEAQIATPRALTISNDRIYAMNLETPDTYQIQVIALDRGAIVDSWPISEVDITPSTFRSAHLVLSPEGDTLTLLTTRLDREQDRWFRELTTYDLESGEALNSLTLDTSGPEDETEFSVRGASPVAGEHALYSIVQDEAASRVRLQFLDLDTGEISGLLLPLEARALLVAARRGETELHVVPSNTGAVLYVIQSRQRQVTVVDMRTRSLIGVFPITTSAADRGKFASNLNHVAYMETLLSPDGTRMYLAVNRERNLALNSYPIESPVWVLDTTTWEVTDHWMISGMPRQMTMDRDGKQIHLRAVRADRSVHLTTIATDTGEIVNVWEELPSPEWASFSRIGSVAQLYHDQYGIRPRSGPADPVDNPILAVLPGVSVEADGAVAGATVEATVRIVHPLTGELATTDRTLRFSPDATVVVELSNGAERVIFAPASIEPGIYQGPVQLNSAGNWDARVTVINRDGTTWAADQAAAIEVEEGLVAENGSAYRFLVRPANPVNRRTITLRVWMVETDTRERLPEEIEFLDQISDDVRIILAHPSGERIDEALIRIDHASFMGWVRFGAAGEWSVEIVLGMASGERIAISAGTIEINDLTEPYRRNNASPVGGGAAGA